MRTFASACHVAAISERSLHPEAERELEEIAAEIGSVFIDAVEAVVERIVETPNAGSAWSCLPAERGVRRRDVPRFKHRSLAYAVIEDVLWIIAVVHERRRPGYWVDRVKELRQET